MSDEKIGKIDAATFASFLLRRTGAADPSVIVPPAAGIDAGVIGLGDGRVLIVAEDPIFAIPNQPYNLFGWHTVHIGASDVAVMGVKPQYMTYSLLMPPGTSDQDFRTIVDAIDQAAKDLGIAIVGGHTGYYPGFAAPTIGGITVFAVAEKGEYITSAGARPGDDVLLTKGPAIETAALLSVLREQELRVKHPAWLVKSAQDLCWQMSVVADAALAREAGEVTAMHDATEGGVLGGLYEIAEASGTGMVIDEAQIIYPKEVRMVCEQFDLDPLASIAEGTLLLTADPSSSDAIVDHLTRSGIPVSVIGKVTDNPEERTVRRVDGTIEQLRIPERDPFWPVFFESTC